MGLKKSRGDFEICPKCNGIGHTIYELKTHIYHTYELNKDKITTEKIKKICDLCLGSNEVDWITYLTYKGSK